MPAGNRALQPRLDGRVALVVGASQGIGRGYAAALWRAGATVVAAARTLVAPAADAQTDDHSLASMVQASMREGGRVVAVGCDVEVEADVVRLIQECMANFGRIDVVVNVAAVYPRLDALSIDVDTWDHSARVNVRGPYLVLREALPYMIAARSGSVVNITSRSAAPTRGRDLAHADLLLYGVTKAALDRMTTWFAEEVRPYGIAVNALSPGGVLTDGWRRAAPEQYAAAERAGAKHPLPDVIGPALVYLAAQSAATLTGRILHTDHFGTRWPEAPV